MNAFDHIQTAFESAAERFHRSPGMARFAQGEITVAGYGTLLRQIFHHARENPQIQALATVRFRGAQRQMIRRFYKHAIAEIGHDQLALDDLRALGEDVAGIPDERPLPATVALLALPFYQIEHRNPVGYLGYLFFLEFIPTRFGTQYAEQLRGIGVVDDAMSFLRDHATIDVGHNKMMETYIAELVVSDDDLDAVIDTMQATADLYAGMVNQAFSEADEAVAFRAE